MAAEGHGRPLNPVQTLFDLRLTNHNHNIIILSCRCSSRSQPSKRRQSYGSVPAHTPHIISLSYPAGRSSTLPIPLSRPTRPQPPQQSPTRRPWQRPGRVPNPAIPQPPCLSPAKTRPHQASNTQISLSALAAFTTRRVCGERLPSLRLFQHAQSSSYPRMILARGAGWALVLLNSLSQIPFSRVRTLTLGSIVIS